MNSTNPKDVSRGINITSSKKVTKIVGSNSSIIIKPVPSSAITLPITLGKKLYAIKIRDSAPIILTTDTNLLLIKNSSKTLSLKVFFFIPKIVPNMVTTANPIIKDLTTPTYPLTM